MEALSLVPPSLYSPLQNFHRLHRPQSNLFICSKSFLKRVCFSANTPSSSSSPIFLNFFDDPQPQDVKQETYEADDSEIYEGEEEDFEDPILRFFKSRTSERALTQDPAREARFSLQKNRRTSWHLAADMWDQVPEPEIKTETNSYSLSEANQQTPAGRTIAEEILGIAQNLPENRTLGEMLCGFEGLVNQRDCVEALALMGEHGLVKICLCFYEWMGLQNAPLVTARSCSLLFSLMGREGMADDILVMLRNLPDKEEFRDVRIYNAAMSGLSACQRYDDVWKVYEAMETMNVHEDHVTGAIMITIMRKSGRNAKEAWEMFDKMMRKGIQLSEETLGALIKLFCGEGLKEEALIIQSEMEKKGIHSNTIVYNTLMDAYNKSSQIEAVEGLFAEMKAKGLKATTVTYNILMDAYARRMQPDIVEKLLREMEESGLEPNAKSYTCLISAYGRKYKMSDIAADAFLRMKKAGIKPTSHSYTALIHAYSVGEWHEKAYACFEEMRMEGIKPSIETYTALLDAFRRCGDTEKLMEIWKMMIRNKAGGTRVTFNTLLDGFSKQGHYVEARDVISEFGKMGLSPTIMTYNMLMNAYARGGQHSKLPQLLKEMAALNLKPDSITYSTMIYAYIRVRDFKRAFFYHKMMVKSGQVPDTRSYKKLRAILEEKAKTANKKDKSAILGIISSKFGRVKAKRKGKKDEFWKNRKSHPRSLNRDK